jgi:hypothetical protein
MTSIPSLALSLVLTCCGSALLAHEVWIEADQWQTAQGDTISAQVLNGEQMVGIQLPWDPTSIARAQSWTGDANTSLAGRYGDIPALSAPSAPEGLLTLEYQTLPRTVIYTDFKKFSGFLAEKGWTEILARHSSRNLPEVRIKEAFSRFTKALVAVGDGAGSDAARGLEFEIVALDNPYTAEPGTDMRFQIYYRGALLTDNLVTMFERAPGGTVTTSTKETGPEGTVSFGTQAGHTYLIDSVYMREPDRELFIQTQGALWESLWASLTFHVPASQ